MCLVWLYIKSRCRYIVTLTLMLIMTFLYKAVSFEGILLPQKFVHKIKSFLSCTLYNITSTHQNRLINIADYTCFMPTGMLRTEVQLLNNPILCTSLCWLFRARKLPNMFKAKICYPGDQISSLKYAITSVVVRRICRHHALGNEFPSSYAIATYI